MNCVFKTIIFDPSGINGTSIIIRNILINLIESERIEYCQLLSIFAVIFWRSDLISVSSLSFHQRLYRKYPYLNDECCISPLVLQIFSPSAPICRYVILRYVILPLITRFYFSNLIVESTPSNVNNCE